mmetsp:Transcript_81456/g.214863  ORF Transcript_81456/g.214863 Transcript_81456/m.214863 type:complete len:326 (-) Transcript_81456:105-1082(-)
MWIMSARLSRRALLIFLAVVGACAVDKDPLRIEIVLAHFKEDLSWVRQYTAKEHIDVTVYTKSENPPDVAGATILRLPNEGRESQSYLYHIVNHYHELADWTVFSQAVSPSWGYLVGGSANGHLNDQVSFDDYVRPFPKGSDSMFVMTAATQFPRAYQSTRLGIIMQGLPHESSDMCPTEGASGWTDWWFARDHPHLRSGDMLDFYHKYISLDTNEGKPLTLSFAQGGRFAVSRSRIHARPRNYYTNMLMTLSRKVNPQEGFWMEAVWWDVFHPEALQSQIPLCELPVLGETMTRGPYADTGILDAILARVPKQGSDRQLRGSGH